MCPGLADYFLSKAEAAAEPRWASYGANKEYPVKLCYSSFLRATINVDVKAYFVRLVTLLWIGGTNVRVGTTHV